MYALYVDCSFYDLEELINVRDLFKHLLSPYQNNFCGETLRNIGTSEKNLLFAILKT